MRKKRFVLFVVAVLMFVVGLNPAMKDSPVEAQSAGKSGHWVGAWSASLLAAHEGGLSQEGFENQTVRMIVHPNATGSMVRIRFSNVFGTQPLTFEKVTVADTKTEAEVIPGTVQNVTFSGNEEVTIPAGEELFSDPVEFEVKDGKDLTVSVYLANESGPATWHPISSQTTYISEQGDFTDNTNGSAFNQTVDSWFWLSGVDVLTDSNKKSRVIVALGDSITDGYLSTPNENRRWTDVLNSRLDSEIKNQQFSVLNAAITGNRILSDSPIFGVKALDRLERDVFSQTGVTDLILLEGINDIGHMPHVFDADKIIAGIQEIAEKAHERGIRIYVGTLTPFNAYDPGVYFTEEGEQTRQEVNEWIRNNTIVDGVIDFDQILADPNQLDKILPEYDSGDHLHPNDAGLKAMADHLDLSIFQKPLSRGAKVNP
ncbi:SGNH/GDSL hydrolase family protein [Mesobacillus maritimus]|uniref:SGNH/GDSL hydrolase family protein n=1 Tax=Mesobacillus maritimus TaxID=1643336 RepID=UPI00203C7EBF|nr:SGNH/GDSL hydrolase family protein [Mesobacillus maritimus]MCM3588261.1 SGNH/GDSL hydrolase family protein [Mesobacillus maritimus]